MKTRYIEDKMLYILLNVLRVCFVAAVAALAFFCFTGCSDKYDSFVRIDRAPIIVTDKDTMNIRVKDYSGYYAGKGYLKVYAKDTLASGLYFTAVDTTGHLEIFYDSAKVTGPLALNQAAILFVACKDTGIYPLRIRLYDRLDKFSEKVIPVTVSKNEPPVADLQIQTLESSTGRSTLLIDAGASKSRMSRIVAYTFTIDNYVQTLYQSSTKTVLYSGWHRIAVTATDDLGAVSAPVEKRILIP